VLRSLTGLGLAGLWLLWAVALAAPQPPASIQAELARAAPGLNPQALEHALAAMHCALEHGAAPARRLALIDYSLPSSQPRLWLFDLQRRRVLLHEWVAHGRESGEDFAERFSNAPGSHRTSLGLFRTAESYHGRHGYSLRMDGLETGINDRARERAIVIHGAAYVSRDWLHAHGRLGRSLGCPAVRLEVARLLVDQLQGGQFLFAWHPQQDWLQGSLARNCRPRQLSNLP
jgi:hypothetical protein